MKVQFTRITVWVLLVGLLAFLAAGCGQSGSPDNGVGAIQLTSTSDTIPADGKSSTGIQAKVLDSSGQPLPAGTSVSFTTTLGKFETSGDSKIQKKTADESGVVTVSLIAGTEAGTAKVVCKAGRVSQSIDITIESARLTVGKIDVRVSEARLDADGVSQTDVVATVKTSDNQAVPDAEVIFKTELGSITSPHTTDETGKATAVLTSDRFNKSRVEVTAESQGVSDKASLAFSGVTLDLQAQPQSLLSYTPSEPEQNHPKTLITASLKDAAGQPIVNEEIAFTTNLGEFTDVNGAVLESNTVATDANGNASIYLKSSESGDAAVTATRANSPETPKLNNTITVNFNKYLFKLTAGQSSIEVGGATTQLRVVLTDTETNQGVPDVPVKFSTSLGDVSPNTTTTNGNGVAFATLTSGNQSGLATVDAEAVIGSQGITLTDQVFVLFKAVTAGKITLTADPGIIKVNTGSAELRAMVYDPNDNPVGGQDVYFEIVNAPGDDDLYVSPSRLVTDNTGLARATLFAGALPADNVLIAAYTDPSTDPRNPGPNQPIDMTSVIIAGPVANVSISVNLQELIEPALEQGHLEVGVSAIATDINGNPVADGTQVRFGVTSIGFDEDRDGDNILGCWSVNSKTKNECTDVACDPFNPAACFDGAGPNPTAILGLDWFTDDTDLNGNMYNTGGVMAPAEDANGNGLVDCEDVDNDGHFDVGEDLDGDGNLDVAEDLDGDGHLDVEEDLDADGHLDVNEDIDGDGHLDVNEDQDGDGRLDTATEDIDGDGNLDVDEDRDGDNRLDVNEDRDGDGHLDVDEDADEDGNLDVAEDLDGDGRLDRGEDANCNGVLDPGEDIDSDETLDLTEDSNGNGTLDPGEDLNGDGNLDFYEDADGDCRLDTVDEDLDGDGRLDTVNEDRDGDGSLDVYEDEDGDGRLDTVNEDQDGDGHLDVPEDQDGDGRLDVAEDVDGDGRLDNANEDVDGDGRLDEDEDADNDGKLDTAYEDIDGDGVLDRSEDLDGDGRFDVDEDRNDNGVLDPGEDIDGDGRLDADEDLDGDGHFDNVNEDADGNGILNCEDKNGNGVLDPPGGVDIDSPIETEAGVAQSKLVYPMSFANNVKVRITAEAGGISGFYDYILLCTETMVDQGTCGLGY